MVRGWTRWSTRLGEAADVNKILECSNGARLAQVSPVIYEDISHLIFSHSRGYLVPLLVRFLVAKATLDLAGFVNTEVRAKHQEKKFFTHSEWIQFRGLSEFRLGL